MKKSKNWNTVFCIDQVVVCCKKIHFIAHITVTARMKLDWSNRSNKIEWERRRTDIWFYDISNSLCWTQHTCAMPDGDDYNWVDTNLIISSTLRNSSSSCFPVFFPAVKIKWTTTNVFAQFINGTIKAEMILSQKSNYVVKEEEEKRWWCILYLITCNLCWE